MNDQRSFDPKRDPPFDGKPCPCCPMEVRNLFAVAHDYTIQGRLEAASRLDALDIWDDSSGLRAISPEKVLALVEKLEKSWRCFHCDSAFTERDAAEDHFGKYLLDTSACLIDAKAFREMEETVRRYRLEDTDLHRRIHELEASHIVALRRAEEEGYARGTTALARETERAEKAEARLVTAPTLAAQPSAAPSPEGAGSAGGGAANTSASNDGPRCPVCGERAYSVPRMGIFHVCKSLPPEPGCKSLL